MLICNCGFWKLSLTQMHSIHTITVVCGENCFVGGIQDILRVQCINRIAHRFKFSRKLMPLEKYVHANTHFEEMQRTVFWRLVGLSLLFILFIYSRSSCSSFEFKIPTHEANLYVFSTKFWKPFSGSDICCLCWCLEWGNKSIAHYYSLILLH